MPHQCTSCGRTFADGSKEMLSGCPDCGGNKFQFKPAGAVDGGDGGGNHGGRTQRSVGGAAPKKRPEDSPAGDGVAPETGGVEGADSRETADRATHSRSTDSRPTDDRTDDRSAVNRAAATVREWVGSGDRADESATTAGTSTPDDASPSGDAASRDDISSRDDASSRDGATVPDGAPSHDGAVPEDSAQASARRDVVSADELPKNVPEDASAGGAIEERAVSDAPSPDDSERSNEAPAEPESEATEADVPETENVVDSPNENDPGLEELREELNSQFESIRIVNPGQYELNLMELYEREEYIISLQEDGKYVIEVPDAWDAVER